jgi:hypothetical protein
LIEIELRTPIDATTEYRPAARLRVEDDGTYTMSGETNLFITDVGIPDRRTVSGRLTFEDDPEEWARNLHKELRTPYLVSVVIVDSKSAED